MLEDKDLVSIGEVRAKVEKPYAAWLRYRLYNQEQIDRRAHGCGGDKQRAVQQFRRLATEENPNIQMILPLGGSWRCDETYIRVKGRWTYLYRAVDKGGRTIDFCLRRRETSPPRNTSSEKP